MGESGSGLERERDRAVRGRKVGESEGGTERV